MKSKLFFVLLIYSGNLFAQQCLGIGQNCVSPYIEHTPCCDGLSCKAVLRNHFKCYPSQCVEAFASCDPKGPPCCEGDCVVDADQQQICK